MKKIYKSKNLQQLFLLCLVASTYSCQWVITHPKEDKEAINILEEIGKDVYEYESGPKVVTPPMAPKN